MTSVELRIWGAVFGLILTVASIGFMALAPAEVTKEHPVLKRLTLYLLWAGMTFLILMGGSFIFPSFE